MIEKGDANKLITLLQKPEINKAINDFLVHVIMAEEKDVKFKVWGGHTHKCEPNPDLACASCRQLAKEWPQQRYPRRIM